MYKRGWLIIFLAISVVAFILEFLFSNAIILLILDLILLVFAILTFIWSVFAIKSLDKKIGIAFLIISGVLLLLWIIGFLVGLTA